MYNFFLFTESACQLEVTALDVGGQVIGLESAQKQEWITVDKVEEEIFPLGLHHLLVNLFKGFYNADITNLITFGL